ncbi:MAG: DUF2316 family protein [Gordonia sp. (in: high G+C Gram-positive bacteria)]|uniref:DUF2316 family protein n=1 Tax=Gordonia sp. (in: high G+C Gram-positive bacteria) TaxID=84139 RepID=UPI0039E2AEBC
MSLNAEEIRRTRRELQQNLALTGLTVDDVAADLEMDTESVRELLAMAGRRAPAEVWLLRDYLEAAVTDTGGEPVPFTVLTEPSRRKAQRWFDLKPVPARRRTAEH